MSSPAVSEDSRRGDSRGGARFTFVDALRGLAALGVVLFHAVEGHHIDELLRRLPGWVGFGLRHGSLGVAVFFVLSGFVIAHSLYRQRMGAVSLAAFTLRRSIRLDPPYWISMVIAIAFSILASAMVTTRIAHHYSLGQVLAHLVYLQVVLGYPSINAVYWTLCLEIQFYLLYAVLLALSRNNPDLRFQGRATALALTSAAAVSLLWPLGLGPHVPDGTFPPLWHGFLLGALAYWSWRDRGALVVFAPYALTIGVCAIAHRSAFSLACVTTSIALFTVAMAGRLDTAFNWRWLQFLGTISYSLYLVHNPVTGASFRVGQMLTRQTVWGQALWWPISIAACIVFATILWWTVEKPCIRFARKIALSRKASTTLAVAQPQVAK